jgi:hypothetical protein
MPSDVRGGQWHAATRAHPRSPGRASVELQGVVELRAEVGAGHERIDHSLVQEGVTPGSSGSDLLLSGVSTKKVAVSAKRVVVEFFEANVHFQKENVWSPEMRLQSFRCSLHPEKGSVDLIKENLLLRRWNVRLRR